jgi:hypothetical protein
VGSDSAKEEIYFIAKYIAPEHLGLKEYQVLPILLLTLFLIPKVA